MQFFCQLRHARQDGAFTQHENRGLRQQAEGAPALRCGKQHHAAGLGQAIFGKHYADFRLLGLGNIFATTRRIPDHGVAFLLQAFGDAQLHQPAVAAQHHRLLTQFFAQAQRRICGLVLAGQFAAGQHHFAGKLDKHRAALLGAKLGQALVGKVVNRCGIRLRLETQRATQRLGDGV